jgi:putative membrane protein
MNKNFWTQALLLRGSVTPRVAPRVLVFAAFAGAVCWIEHCTGWQMHLAIAPYEVAGAVLGVLLVMRTNAGYDRWWEARKLWGGIVNQTRNFSIMVIEYGPDDVEWRRRIVHLAALFPHAVRCGLLGQRQLADAFRLVGPAVSSRIEASGHMAICVSQLLAAELRQAADSGQLDRFAFAQADRERALLIDHLGACERILKTPLPTVYAIKTRRFIFLFLATLPFALLDRAGHTTPFVVALVAYSLLALDQIGVELEDPFSVGQLSRLPLDDICQTIEGNAIDSLKSARMIDNQPNDELLRSRGANHAAAG